MRERQRSKRDIKDQLEKLLVGTIRPQHLEREPYFPDLLRQPDLVFSRRAGDRSAIYIYESADRKTWTKALACIEDLIETKLVIGDETFVTAVFYATQDQPPINLEIEALFDRSFDFVYAYRRGSPARIEFGAFGRPKAESNFSIFINQEKINVRNELTRFDEAKYLHLVNPNSPPTSDYSTSENAILRALEYVLGLDVERHPSVKNVKGFIGGLRQSYRFDFDFAVHGRHDLFIDIVRSGRYGERNKYRYLSAKGRLLRYDVIDGQLLPSKLPLRPVLIIDGNLAGPSHDPFRYVRTLLSVGWEIVAANRLERIRDLVHDENL
jgi:hypothetical protein